MSTAYSLYKITNEEDTCAEYFKIGDSPLLINNFNSSTHITPPWPIRVIGFLNLLMELKSNISPSYII